MDTGLIFPDRRTGEGGTENINSGALLDWRLCSKGCLVGKSARRAREYEGLQPQGCKDRCEESSKKNF